MSGTKHITTWLLFSDDKLNIPREFQNVLHNAQEKSFSDSFGLSSLVENLPMALLCESLNPITYLRDPVLAFLLFLLFLYSFPNPTLCNTFTHPAYALATSHDFLFFKNIMSFYAFEPSHVTFFDL